MIEKIGLIIMAFGLLFMILNDVWENNPIPGLLSRNQMFLWGGLVFWAFGNIKGGNEQKNKN